jgi:hypothetical protein
VAMVRTNWFGNSCLSHNSRSLAIQVALVIRGFVIRGFD